jgi:hypothetical protein
MELGEGSVPGGGRRIFMALERRRAEEVPSCASDGGDVSGRDAPPLRTLLLTLRVFGSPDLLACFPCASYARWPALMPGGRLLCSQPRQPCADPSASRRELITRPRLLHTLMMLRYNQVKVATDSKQNRGPDYTGLTTPVMNKSMSDSRNLPSDAPKAQSEPAQANASP